MEPYAKAAWVHEHAVRRSGSRVPETTTTDGQVQLVGDTAIYSEQRVKSGGFVVESKGCLITYFAEWNAEATGWIVVDISYPHRLFC